MTSRIIVNNIQSDTGISTITISSPIALSGGITGTGFAVGTGASIGSPATNVLTVSTNNVERVRVDSGGRLGIGTDIPGSMLHLLQSSGNAKITIQRSNTASNTDDYGSILWRSSAANNNGSIGVARESAENNGYMYFSTGSGGTLTERVRIDSSGRVTMPYQPVTCVYDLSASQNTGGEGTWQVVKFIQTVVNRGSSYNSSTGLFTCPVAGVYFVSVYFLTRATAAHNITIYKNGSGIGVAGRDITPSGTEQNTGLSAYVDCAANDTLGIYISNGASGDFYVNYNGLTISLFG